MVVTLIKTTELPRISPGVINESTNTRSKLIAMLVFQEVAVIKNQPNKARPAEKQNTRSKALKSHHKQTYKTRVSADNQNRTRCIRRGKVREAALPSGRPHANTPPSTVGTFDYLILAHNQDQPRYTTHRYAYVIRSKPCTANQHKHRTKQPKKPLANGQAY